MKKFLADKIFSKITRWEFLYLAIPFALWIFCFRNFLTGHLDLQQDALSYADHIGFYTDNLSKGVFPLWDPAWISGAPYHFFLRRIGDVNPFYFVIVLLKWLGMPSAGAYLFFLGMYYFLAVWAFYLIARFLFADRFFAFTAYILLLFSSWGCVLFYNYILIIFVPMIWFFYFLLSFSREAKRGFFLGMCFCAGIIVTTYIPFYFLTVFTLFTFLYILFYGNVFLLLIKQSFAFFRKNKIFTCFCIIFLLASCIPALVFYKESKSGEFVLPDRHSGANTSSEVAVGVNNVASGDIISHGEFDRIFSDQGHIDIGDLFVPYLFFLILLSGTCGRVNKLIFFLLFNILGLSVITITSAAGLHRFLYDHILFFKFIRNIYYFFWLAMLPMGILLSVAAFKSLLTAIDRSTKKTGWLFYIIFCHAVFALFLFREQGILWGGWAAILISLLYFWVYLRYENKISYPAGFCLFLLSVFIQSAQVYGTLNDEIFQIQRSTSSVNQPYETHQVIRMTPYYASGWLMVLIDYIDPQVLVDYRKREFIFYDNVLPYIDSPGFFKTLQKAMAANANVAFIPKPESQPADWRSDHDAGPQADPDPESSGKLSLLHSDVNTWRFKTHLSESRFLVINDNYNSAWHAYINGRQARLFRANVSFKGLWIPSGESTVILRFSNPLRYALHFLLIISFAGTFLYLLILLRKGRYA